MLLGVLGGIPRGVPGSPWGLWGHGVMGLWVVGVGVMWFEGFLGLGGYVVVGWGLRGLCGYGAPGGSQPPQTP